MEKQMNARDLAGRLRKRLKVLKARREKEVKKFHRDFEAWKKACAVWLKTEAPKRMLLVTKGECRGWQRYNLPDSVCRGMPPKPSLGKPEEILSIQKTLRFIAFTGAKTVNVSKGQIQEWFGDEGLDVEVEEDSEED